MGIMPEAVQNTREAGARVFRLLIVEDDPADLELTRRELRNGGVSFECAVVCKPDDFLERIRRESWDAVLCDFRLPGWDGIRALEQLRALGLEIPFLLITGTLGEEKALECMRLGANDCILKDRLGRLPMALRAAVERNELRERQRRIAEELWTSESKLGMLLSQLPAIIWTTDRELRLTSLTGGGLGRLPETAWQRRWMDLVRDARHPALAAHRRALAGDSVDFEDEIEGRAYWNRVEPFHDVAGDTSGCLGFALDISEKKQIELESELRGRELRQANDTLAAMVANAPVAIVAMDHAGRVRIWNPAAERMFGWRESEVLGGAIPYLPAERQSEHLVFRELLNQGGSISNVETQRRTKDGTLLDVSLSAASVKHDAGSEDSSTELETIAVLTDITARKQAELEKQRLSTAIEQSAEAVMIADTDGFIRYVNPALCAMTGYSPAEAVGKRTNLLRSGRHDERFYATLWNTILSGQTWRGEFENRRKDGSPLPMEAAITPVRGPHGAITSFICIAQDISERRELERQLLQAQKFEAIGQLAGGIAHDFNNVLGAILGMAELAQLEAPDGTRIRERLEKICHHAGRAVALTRQLLAFSRRQQLERRAINLNLSTNEVCSLLNDSLGKDVELVTELAPELASVFADPSQIEQVLMNLCVNARDAMPSGGRLTISTSNVRLDEDACRTRPGTVPGEFVCMTVKDTGTGMDAETLGRIFEPFFTTKPPGRGTGLGLATVYGVVKQHGGHIDVLSEVGRGTTFRLYFPVSKPERAQPATRAEQEPVTGGKETILLAEDHEGLRELVSESLESLGYQVLTACDGEEAIELFRRNAGKVDLLILDVIMPRMRGPDAYKRIRELNGAVPVLFCTGYSSESTQVETLSGHPVLQKPYQTRELARTVRHLLDAPPPPDR